MNNRYDEIPAIAVQFPLPGEWIAVSTPGHKIPSHGTDFLGQRYAYDFLTTGDQKLAETFLTGLRYWVGGGIPLTQSSSWQVPILSPVSGKIIAAKDGFFEPQKASPLDLYRMISLGLGLRGGEADIRNDYRIVTGNYLIIEAKDCWAFLAHATTGSIRVNEGNEVVAGQHVANVGHTGNSSQPHLHFHLMDGPDLWTANGLPCSFKRYEQRVDGQWQRVENAIPDNVTPIRSVEL